MGGHTQGRDILPHGPKPHCHKAFWPKGMSHAAKVHFQENRAETRKLVSAI